MFLLIESGSTKTDWVVMDKGSVICTSKTMGMNPFLCSHEDYHKIINDDLKLDVEKNEIKQIAFYGAGVKDSSKAQYLGKSLKKYFTQAKVSVNSDMLGAAISVCGTQKGVCCILGTGSNSAYYNGEKISKQLPSLGYILGDEGSGSHLGKKVLQYYFYKTFDEQLSEAFHNKYGDNLTEILDHIYKCPFPNRYLASYALFLSEHRGHYMVENIIEDSLIEFHQKHVLKYRESWKHPIHFIGSIADAFKDVILSLHTSYGLETGIIAKSPLDGLIAYYKKHGALID